MSARNRWVPSRAPRTRKLSRRRLAAKYVAVVTGRKFGQRRRGPARAIDGADKRETMRAGKRLAWDMYPGAVVTLRANSARGPIIERVVMEATTSNGLGYVWRQTFET